MKKIVSYLLSVVVVPFAVAQSNGDVNTVPLEGVTVSSLNLDYEYAVIDQELPESVQNLQRKVARFDVTEMPEYNGKFEAYEVLFEQDKNSIIATYDSKGKITKSFERFRNITLPPNVREYLWQENPGWKIHKDIYMITYYDDKETRRVCKVQLRKDGEKRNLKLDVNSIDQAVF